MDVCSEMRTKHINPLNAELNPIRHLLALVGARHIVHVSRVRVNMLWAKSRVFRRVRKIARGDYSLHVLSVCPHGTRLPLDGFT